MISFQKMHKNNYNVLGRNYENLGRWIGYRKIYLSYSNNKGWGIEKLNIIEFIFRKLFCFMYRSTHLNIFKKHFFQITEEELPIAEKELPNEIKIYLAKKLSNQKKLCLCPCQKRVPHGQESINIYWIYEPPTNKSPPTLTRI